MRSISVGDHVRLHVDGLSGTVVGLSRGWLMVRVRLDGSGETKVFRLVDVVYGSNHEAR